MKKVIIVDDNCLTAEGIEKNINWASLGVEILAVTYNGISALDIMKENSVDLLISDIELPDLDGIALSRQALSQNPLLKIILVSAYDKFEYAKQAIRLGVFDYIEKPLDYSYLTEKIRNALAETDRIRKNMEIIQASRPLMTDKFFHDLLHYPGKNAESYLGRYGDYLDLNYNYDCFNVLIFDLETSADAQQDPDFTSSQIELLNILDLIQETFSVFDKVYYLKEFHSIICIIAQNTKHPRHFLTAVHKCVSTITSQYQNYPFALNIGIGTAIDNFWNLPLSYTSASHALKYRFFFPHQNIFDAREALGKDFSLLSFSETEEEDLIRLICRKDIPAIHQWLTSFFLNLTDKIKDKNIVFIRIYSLLGRILKFLYEMNVDTEIFENQIIDVYKHFDSFHTYEQLIDWITNLCRDACKKIDTSLQSYHNQIYTMALNYIKENFESSTLCLSDIAHYANISPAYLSSLFKKACGSSISDTIATLRIERACYYLNSTNMSLKEISTRCGYANQYYFSNSFKKRMGCSPSSFREDAQR